MCFENPEAAGSLDEGKARQLAKRFLDKINDYTEASPRLGLATTIDLITELQSRVDTAFANGEDWATYRTVGSE